MGRSSFNDNARGILLFFYFFLAVSHATITIDQSCFSSGRANDVNVAIQEAISMAQNAASTWQSTEPRVKLLMKALIADGNSYALAGCKSSSDSLPTISVGYHGLLSP